jgi:hypothetical protein
MSSGPDNASPPPRIEAPGSQLTKEPLLRASKHKRGDGIESPWEQLVREAPLLIQVVTMLACWIVFTTAGNWGYAVVAAVAWPYLRAMHSTVIHQGAYRALLNVPISVLVAWSFCGSLLR